MASKEEKTQKQKEKEAKKARIREERQKRREARFSSTKVLDCVAYFAIMFIALALIFRLIFAHTNVPKVAESFQIIGECLAYIICIWLGFYWTMKQKGARWNKHTIWWLICYIVATVVIIVIYILAVVKV